VEKKNEPSYLRNVLVASIVSAIVLGYPIIVYLNKVQIQSLICGYGISLLNALVGYKMNDMAFNRSVKSFMILVFGGMGLRMILVGVLLLIVIYYTQLDSVSLISSVFVFYILFAGMEIQYLHKKQLLDKKNKETGSGA
jgi:hypothetical protein